SIDQAVTARTDHSTHRRRTNNFPESQRTEARREHLRIRRRAPVLQNDLRSEEARKRTARRFSAARLPNLILALDQDREQLLFDVAAAIPALIDHHRFLVAKLAKLFLKLSQRRWIHCLDVQVADTSARKLVDFLPALFDPPVIAQLRVNLRRNGLNSRLPGAVLRRFIVERNGDLAIERVVQKRPVIVTGFHLLAVDRDQVVAVLDAYPVFIGWPIFIDVSDAITSGGSVRLELDAEVQRRNTIAACSTWRRRRRACVRSIQLTNHLVDDVEQLLTIADVIDERPILRAHRVPIHA